MYETDLSDKQIKKIPYKQTNKPLSLRGCLNPPPPPPLPTTNFNLGYWHHRAAAGNSDAYMYVSHLLRRWNKNHRKGWLYTAHVRWSQNIAIHSTSTVGYRRTACCVWAAVNPWVEMCLLFFIKYAVILWHFPHFQHRRLFVLFIVGLLDKEFHCLLFVSQND